MAEAKDIAVTLSLLLTAALLATALSGCVNTAGEHKGTRELLGPVRPDNSRMAWARLSLVFLLLNMGGGLSACSPSLALRAVGFFARTTMAQESDLNVLHRKYEVRNYPQPYAFPSWLRQNLRLNSVQVGGQRVYRVTSNTKISRWHIIYTHGGAYVEELSLPHWLIIDALISYTGATVWIPLYPLAPEHQYMEAYAFLEQFYRQLLKTVPAEQIVFCGDSAGGGLAMGQALAYRDKGLPLPSRVILFAPWLDVTLSNQDIDTKLQADDVLLSIDALRLMGRWWSGAADPRSPMVSPIFGNMKGLPPVLVFQGTKDIFLPDARVLRRKVIEAGGKLDLYEEEGFHVFMGAVFAPESQKVFRRIADELSVHQ